MTLRLDCRVDQLETGAGESMPEGAQLDPAWLAARRQAMHVHVSCGSYHSLMCTAASGMPLMCLTYHADV